MLTQLENKLAGFHERQPVQDRASGQQGEVVAVCDRMVCVRFGVGERRWLFPDELAPLAPLVAAAA
jgi:hypothetical protein